MKLRALLPLALSLACVSIFVPERSPERSQIQPTQPLPKPHAPAPGTNKIVEHHCGNHSCSHDSHTSQGLPTQPRRLVAWPDDVITTLIEQHPEKTAAIEHIREATSFENYAALSTDAAERLIRYSDGVLNRPLALSPFLCWSASVSPAERSAFEEVRSLAFTKQGSLPSAMPALQGDDRWGFTDPDGFTGGEGTPVTIYWSFVPDGTIVPDGNNATAPSDLIAKLNAAYGASPNPNDLTQAPWFPLFDNAFNFWAVTTGNVYIYEPNDDGLDLIDFNNFTSPRGQIGVRGDVRIGGTRIDGNSNVLAFNYFPDVGDMVIDSADSSNLGPGRENFFTNVIAHEHGHGMGLSHVCPVDRTKLMEPFASSSFVGPQFDDILTAQELYGDPLERQGNNKNNNTIATAHNLGLLNDSFNANNLSIANASDVDLFRFQLSGARDLSLTVSPTTQAAYLEGQQNNNGTCSSGTTFAPRTRQNLLVRVLAPDGITVLASSDSGGLGQTEQISNVQLSQANQNYYIEVTGGGENSGSVNNAQMYDIQLNLTDVSTIRLSNFTLTAESCIPANGSPAPGETVQAQVTITNTGTTTATNTSLTLNGSNDLSIDGDATQPVPDLAPNESTTVSYQFSLSGDCGDSETIQFQISSSIGSNALTQNLTLGVETNLFAENFDSTTLGQLPSPFSQSSSNSAANWSTSNSNAASTPNAARTKGSSSTNSAYLVAETLPTIQADSELRFDHSYAIETQFDGGVLEISINGGNWQEWTAAGGSFTQNGYDATISTNYNNPIGGQSAWTGNSGRFVTTIAQFPAAATEQNVQLRWHMASDSSIDSDGWAVDNITISGFECCEQTLPTLSITAIDPVAMEFDASDTGEFVITSSQAIGVDLEISYSISGTATNGDDFTPLAGTITLPANEDMASIILTAVSDSETEGAEEVILTLNSSPDYALATDQAKVIIEDLPFDNYRAENFGNAVENIADDEDFDFDGIANLLEYAFRLDPTQSTTLPIETELLEDGSMQLQLTYVEDTELADISYIVETISELGADNWTQAGVTIERGSTNDGLQTVTATITVSGDAKFMRIRVERITP
ncbi:MAG: matrixin family metalloprotease [Coraliomargarita sp.]